MHKKAVWKGDDIQCFYAFEVISEKSLGCSVFSGIGKAEIKNIGISDFEKIVKSNTKKRKRRVSGEITLGVTKGVKERILKNKENCKKA